MSAAFDRLLARPCSSIEGVRKKERREKKRREEREKGWRDRAICRI